MSSTKHKLFQGFKKTQQKEKNSAETQKKYKIQKLFSQQQDYFVPFLFQQDINKKFTGIDLFYYDEVWNPPRQAQNQINSFFQKQFSQLKQIQKKSASPTIVYRGLYKGRKIYVKSFKCGKDKEELFKKLEVKEQILSYEKEVYRYIRSVADKNDEIRQHFIQMLFCAKDATNGRAYIFSQDSGGKPLYYYLFNNTNVEFVKNVFTQYLHLLYLLHNVLHIYHNDLHLGNIMVIKDKQPTKTYSFGGKNFKLENHPYYLMVYDFDRSSIFSPYSYRNVFLQYNDETDVYKYFDLLLTEDLFKFDTPYNEISFKFLQATYSCCLSKIQKNFQINVQTLINIWWNAIHSDINTSIQSCPREVLEFLLKNKKYFGHYVFFIIKNNEYKIVFSPTKEEIRIILEMNKYFKGNFNALLLPNFIRYKHLIWDIIVPQYKKTNSFKQVQDFIIV